MNPEKRSSPRGYSIQMANKEGKKMINLDLNVIDARLTNAFNANGLNRQGKQSEGGLLAKKTFVKNTLNMILHGRLNPYKVDDFFTYAPFT